MDRASPLLPLFMLTIKEFKKKIKKLLTKGFESVNISNVPSECGPLAQLEEHLTLNQGVQGSSP